MLTGLFTNGEGQDLQPNREGSSGSLVFTHAYGQALRELKKVGIEKNRRKNQK